MGAVCSVKIDSWKKRLQPGDEFQWSDPDKGTCSRNIVIKTIEYLNEHTIRVMEPDGSVLECYLWEIS